MPAPSAPLLTDLAPTDELLHTLLDLSLTGVLFYTPIYDAAGEIVDMAFAYLNPAAQRILRLPAQPAATHLQQFPQSQATGAFAFQRDTFLSGEPGQFEINYQADGYDNYFWVAARRVGAELLISFTDTADQPRTAVETALRESQAREQLARRKAEAQRQRLHDLFMNAPTLIALLTGPDHVFALANPRYQQLFGNRPLLGKPSREALPELAGQPFFSWYDEVYRTGKTYYGRETVAHIDRTNSGALETSYYNFIYPATRDSSGTIDGILTFTYDVTEQVQARQQVQQLNQELAAINEKLQITNQELTRTNVDLDNFIYTASHDLRAPITNIEGILHTLQRELPTQSPAGEVVYLLELMQGAIDRFKRTIEHLTDVSRLQKEHGQAAVQVRPADVIEDVRLDLAPLLSETRGHLDVDVRSCPTLTFSEKNLRSVVYNLISNALKYHHPDRPPQVRVRCRAEDHHLVLDVHDNGLGIDLTRERQLFAMFERYHTHVEGSGIGLYIVKKMMENAGGRIEVRSQVNVGSTFSVYFPH